MTTIRPSWVGDLLLQKLSGSIGHFWQGLKSLSKWSIRHPVMMFRATLATAMAAKNKRLKSEIIN